MEWFVSNVTTQILIHTYKFRATNKSLPPLHIFVSQNPWQPFLKPNLIKTVLGYNSTYVTSCLRTTTLILLWQFPFTHVLCHISYTKTVQYHKHRINLINRCILCYFRHSWWSKKQWLMHRPHPSIHLSICDFTLYIWMGKYYPSIYKPLMAERENSHATPCLS